MTGTSRSRLRVGAGAAFWVDDEYLHIGKPLLSSMGYRFGGGCAAGVRLDVGVLAQLLNPLRTAG
ncbi:hypothetical protein [Gloeobacter violaceus]|uniref:hypothetical protein n=1 Tax=Gloeobacter violaceus TaxID=33072 RepID=UPI0013E8B7A6|nr:hypothetical protein [Gloeobacter violaceus]